MDGSEPTTSGLQSMPSSPVVEIPSDNSEGDGLGMESSLLQYQVPLE